MDRHLSSREIPLFSSKCCNCQYYTVHQTWAIFLITFMIVWLEFYEHPESFKWIWTSFTLSIIYAALFLIRYTYLLWEVTATKIIYNDATQMITISSANFCYLCCPSSTLIWESNINDIAVAGYTSKSSCETYYCGDCCPIYAVSLLAMRENSEGCDVSLFEKMCDAYCQQKFISLVESLKNNYGLAMEIVDEYDVLWYDHKKYIFSHSKFEEAIKRFQSNTIVEEQRNYELVFSDLKFQRIKPVWI